MMGTTSLFILLSAASIASAAFNCPGLGNYPNPEACNSFYSCGVAGAQLITCPSPLQFNSQYQNCVLPENSDCFSQSSSTSKPTTAAPTTTSNPSTENPTTSKPSTSTAAPTTSSPEQPQCSVDAYDFFQNLADCTTFYVCNDGIKLLESCPSGYGFDPVTKDCLPAAEIGCDTNTTPVPPTTGVNCPATGQAIIPDSETCKTYYVCTDGSADVLTCPVGYEFNAVALKCDPEDVVNCNGEGVSTVKPSECSGRPNGDVFGDPADCSKYYQCSNGQVVSNKCPPGLEFNAAQKVCDNPASANCTETF